MKFNFNKLEKRVKFEAEGHTYTDQDGRNYISVTTLIDLYSRPFEKDKWSTYKACKDIMGNAGIWDRYKKAAGGWEAVYPYYEKNKKELDALIVLQISERKQYYLDKWDKERIYSAGLGNKQHDEREALMYKAKKVRVSTGQQVDVSAEELLGIQNFYNGTSGVYPELQIWNEQFGISGKADVIERVNNKIVVRDYKTCKEIKFDPFMDQAMLEPLEQLPNTNYSKFTIQMSLYAWMLEQLGFEVGGMIMEHIDRHTGKKIRNYPMAYRKDLIEKMLEDYDSKRT